MKPEIKGIHSPDVYDLTSFIPEESDNFSFLLQIMIGPQGVDGEESFDVEVVTPKYLLQSYNENEVILGSHKLIVFKYNYAELLKKIEAYVSSCAGENWDEIAMKLNLLGKWEFDGYVD